MKTQEKRGIVCLLNSVRKEQCSRHFALNASNTVLLQQFGLLIKSKLQDKIVL